MLEREEGGLLRTLAEEGEGIAEGRLENWRLSLGCRGGHSDHSLWPLFLLEMEEAQKKRKAVSDGRNGRNGLHYLIKFLLLSVIALTPPGCTTITPVKLYFNLITGQLSH